MTSYWKLMIMTEMVHARKQKMISVYLNIILTVGSAYLWLKEVSTSDMELVILVELDKSLDPSNNRD